MFLKIRFNTACKQAFSWMGYIMSNLSFTFATQHDFSLKAYGLPGELWSKYHTSGRRQKVFHLKHLFKQTGEKLFRSSGFENRPACLKKLQRDAYSLHTVTYERIYNCICMLHVQWIKIKVLEIWKGYSVKNSVSSVNCKNRTILSLLIKIRIL